MKLFFVVTAIFVVISLNAFAECNYSWKGWRSATANAKGMQDAGCTAIQIADIFERENKHFGINIKTGIGKIEIGSKYKRAETYWCIPLFSPCTTAQKVANRTAKLKDAQARRRYILETYKNKTQLEADKYAKEVKRGKDIAAKLIKAGKAAGERSIELAAQYEKGLVKVRKIEEDLKNIDTKIIKLEKTGASKNKNAYKEAVKIRRDLVLDLDEIKEKLKKIKKDFYKFDEESKTKLNKAENILGLFKDSARYQYGLIETGNKLQKSTLVNNSSHEVSDAEMYAKEMFELWDGQNKKMDSFMKDVKLLDLQVDNKKLQLDTLMNQYANQMRNSLFEKYMNEKLAAVMNNLCKSDTLADACSRKTDTISDIHQWLNNASRTKGKEWYSEEEIKDIFSGESTATDK